jgi:hypothetical protein
MLVALGEFLFQHGLMDSLMKVPIPQRTRHFAPQAKLVEFLAAILSGSEHLEDLNDGPRPLAKDPVVARAWGQAGFAHYSSVSRTLDACTQETVVAVEQAINEFSHPFIATAIQGLLRRGADIIYDFDLTGQAVSSSSSTYPEAAFGWMADSVKLGYQLARVCLSPSGEARVWLAGFHHPGDTVSTTCLHELVRAAETQAGIRPRRRTELLQQRLVAQDAAVVRGRRLVAQHQKKLDNLRRTQTRLICQVYHAEELRKGSASQQDSARSRFAVASWRKRLPRLEVQIVQTQRTLTKQLSRLAEQANVLEQLHIWQAQLTADNQANPDPPPYIEARMDAGFVSGENLTWLLEMGYCPNTKASNERTTTILRARLSPQSCWVRVGHHVEMTAWGDYDMNGCPFPLMVALERFQVGSAYKYATLIHYRDDGVFPTLPVWFHHYNERQTIEAGNKELKGTFFVQHLMSRSLAGIRLQVLFTGLAANAVRWCVPWLQSCASKTTAKLAHTLASPKHLVHVAANAAATVQQTIFGTAVQFAPDGPLPGVILFLKGVPAFQLALGFNQPCKFASG